MLRVFGGSDPSTCVAVAFARPKGPWIIRASAELESMSALHDRRGRATSRVQGSSVTCVVMTPLSFAFVRIGSSDGRILGRDVHAEKLCGSIIQSNSLCIRRHL